MSRLHPDHLGQNLRDVKYLVITSVRSDVQSVYSQWGKCSAFEEISGKNQKAGLARALWLHLPGVKMHFTNLSRLFAVCHTAYYTGYRNKTGTTQRCRLCDLGKTSILTSSFDYVRRTYSQSPNNLISGKFRVFKEAEIAVFE